MGLLKKIADYIKKADNAITDFAQDLSEVGTGYKLEFATAYGNAVNTKQRFDAVGDMHVGTFIREGLYELEDIKNSVIKSTKDSYNNLKDITTSFFDKRRKKSNKRTKEQNEANKESNGTIDNNFENQKTSKEDSIENIIKKDEVEKIKKPYETKTTKEYTGSTVQSTVFSSQSDTKPKTTYNLGTSYKSNMSNILKTYDTNISGIAQTLSGKQTENKKKIWKWTDRIDEFNKQINKTVYSAKDIQGLEHIRETINSNKYLQRKHTDIAKDIAKKLDDIIKLYK